MVKNAISIPSEKLHPCQGGVLTHRSKTECNLEPMIGHNMIMNFIAWIKLKKVAPILRIKTWGRQFNGGAYWEWNVLQFWKKRKITVLRRKTKMNCFIYFGDNYLRISKLSSDQEWNVKMECFQYSYRELENILNKYWRPSRIWERPVA